MSDSNERLLQKYQRMQFGSVAHNLDRSA